MTDKSSRLWEIVGNYKPEEALRAEAVALRARMVSQIGDTAARSLWDEVGAVNRGRIPGSGGAHDALFCLAYDSTATRPEFAGWKREQIASAVAGKFFDLAKKQGAPARYGASVSAITQAIKRALAKREKKQKLLVGVGAVTLCPCCLKPSSPQELQTDRKARE